MKVEALSPDSRTLIARGLKEREYKLIDVTTLRERSAIQASVVTSTPQGEFVNWDIDHKTGHFTGRIISEGHERPYCSLRLGAMQSCWVSNDSSLLATTSQKGEEPPTLRVTPVTTGQTRGLSFPPDYIPSVRALEFSPDGTNLAVGSWHGAIILWDIPTGRVKGSMLATERVMFPVLAFSPDSKSLATGCHDGQVDLWDAADLRHVARLAGYHQTVWTVTFSPDGKTLASGGRDGLIKLWDVRTREERLTIQGPKSPILGLLFTPDSRSLFVTTNEGTAVLRTSLTEASSDPKDGKERFYRHRKIAASADRNNQHRQAVFHYTQALKLVPDHWITLSERGQTHAKLGDHRLALADFNKALEIRTDELELLVLRGQSQLYLQPDGDAYRRTCQEVLRLHESGSRLDDPVPAAWFCSLVAQDSVDGSRVVKLIEKQAVANPEDYRTLRAHAAALLRAGKLKDAIDMLRKVSSLRPETPAGCLLLAIALQKDGQRAEAKRWLDKARTWHEQALKQKKDDPIPEGKLGWHKLSWGERFSVELLRKEAEALLKD